MEKKVIRTKEEEMSRLKQIQEKYGITEQMLSESEAELSPRRMLQGLKPKKK